MVGYAHLQTSSPFMTYQSSNRNSIQQFQIIHESQAWHLLQYEASSTYKNAAQMIHCHGVPAMRKSRLSFGLGHSSQLLRELIQDMTAFGAMDTFDTMFKLHLELCIHNTQQNTDITVDPASVSNTAPRLERRRPIRWIDEVVEDKRATHIQDNCANYARSPEIGPTGSLYKGRQLLESVMDVVDAIQISFGKAECELNLLHSDVLALRFDNHRAEALVRRAGRALDLLDSSLSRSSRSSRSPSIATASAACLAALAAAPEAFSASPSNSGPVLAVAAAGSHNLSISSPLPRIRNPAARLPLDIRGGQQPAESPEALQALGQELVEQLEPFDDQQHPARRAGPLVLSDYAPLDGAPPSLTMLGNPRSCFGGDGGGDQDGGGGRMFHIFGGDQRRT